MQPTLAPAPAPTPRTAPVDSSFGVHRQQADYGQHPPSENASDQALRERLQASLQPNLQTYHQHRPDPSSQHPPPPHMQNHNIDPAIAGTGVINQYPSVPEAETAQVETRPPRGNVGRRELSTTKRAAQNRAAQRAFRQRKEGHIRDLESQVNQVRDLTSQFQGLQSENETLKSYVIALQGELLQKAGHFPPPPAHINIRPRENNAPTGPPLDQGASDDQSQANGQAPMASMRSYEQDLQSSAVQAVAEHQHRNQDPELSNAGPAKRKRTVSPRNSA